MDLFTVSFFGHRIVPEFREAEERVESLIHTLLLEKEYVEFLVGRNGDFDQIVSSAVKRQQRRVRDDNSALILVLPYPTAELRDNLENFEAYYDEIELCSAAAGSHPKGRSATGRWWIEATLWYSVWITPAAEHIKLCVTPRERKKKS